ncbi:hypothetical protein EDC01DRAFT_658306 [Geopyxis carbonaria]|nr:hypothetical protein EDC01DRAFT_658306 [Geopyxis carbonaria]
MNIPRWDLHHVASANCLPPGYLDGFLHGCPGVAPSYTAEADIFERWLLGKSTHNSDFVSHVPTCAILDGLLKLAADDWRGDIEMDFNYPAPADWPTFSQYDDPWYAYMADNVAFSSEHSA